MEQTPDFVMGPIVELAANVSITRWRELRQDESLEPPTTRRPRRVGSARSASRVQPPLPHVAFLKRETSEPPPAHIVAVSASIIALPRPKSKIVPALVLTSKPAVQSFGFAQDRFCFLFPSDFNTGGEHDALPLSRPRLRCYV